MDTWFQLVDPNVKWVFIDASTGEECVTHDFIEAILRTDCGVSLGATPLGIKYSLGHVSMYGSPMEVIKAMHLPIAQLDPHKDPHEDFEKVREAWAFICMNQKFWPPELFELPLTSHYRGMSMIADLSRAIRKLSTSPGDLLAVLEAAQGSNDRMFLEALGYIAARE